MNRKAIKVLLCSLAIALSGACNASRAEAPVPVTSSTTEGVHGKPSAPVTVSAEVARSSARVTVRFDADVTDARVQVRGVDGLVVTSEATPVDGGAFARGDGRTFDVRYTAGDGGHLVVAVSTVSSGGARARVASFAVGERGVGRSSAGASSTGERRRLVPVQGP